MREGLGDIWYSRDIQKAMASLRSKVTLDEKAKAFKRRQDQGLPTDSASILEEAALGRLMNSDGRTGIAGHLHNVIRAGIKQKFGFNVPVAATLQLKEAMTQFLRNRTAPPPGLGLPPKGMIPLGKWGEAWLSHVLKGAGTKPSSPFKTSFTYRFPDRVFNKIAHESKAGLNVKLNDRIRMQILKDADLIRLKKFDAVHWHFFRGAQPDVLKFLEQNGIGYTIY